MIVEYLHRREGRAPARPAGEVDRDPLREHARDVARPRPRALRRDGHEARRQDQRPARAHPRRRGCVPGRRRVPSVLHADDVAERVRDPEGRVQLAGRGHEHDSGRARTAARAARRRSTSSSARSTSRPTSSASIRSTSASSTTSRPRRSRSRRSPGSARSTTAASTRRRSTSRSRRRATTTCAPSRRRVALGVTPRCSASGSSSYLEISAPLTFNREYGSVEIEDDGKVTARVGTSAHGQGHETTFAMIISDALGVPMEDVRVVHSDTAEVSRGGGTGGSRSLQIGGSALFRASEEVLAQAKQLAAHMLEANPDDIVIGDGGGLEVAGVPASRLSWAELAASREGSAAPARRHARPLVARARLRVRRVVVPVRFAHRGGRGRRRHGEGRARCASSPSTTAARSSTRCSSRASSTAASARASRRRSTKRSATTKTATRSPAT